MGGLGAGLRARDSKNINSRVGLMPKVWDKVSVFVRGGNSKMLSPERKMYSNRCRDKTVFASSQFGTKLV
ncbi:hypothetical protein GWI33_022370 [Rhynchophorus ferrugineus]|uniref:Uncharacterized protein n=1 Tax=Rhynchophorus ferrugineus TaxID=354439 RepID=A0A834MHV6_RHYFE|nr:hypothetical protein GWI33_022370 [Rhynchophorus ferrugineus]